MVSILHKSPSKSQHFHRSIPNHFVFLSEFPLDGEHSKILQLPLCQIFAAGKNNILLGAGDFVVQVPLQSALILEGRF